SIERAARRWLRRARAADELERLRVERCERTRADLVRFLEKLPCVVARRIGFGRRSTELQFWIQHAIEQRLGRHVDAGCGKRAQAIAREHDWRSGAAGAPERLRVIYIRRSKYCSGLPLLDPLAQQARRPEGRGNSRLARSAECSRHFGHGS